MPACYTGCMTELKKLAMQIVKFRDERDWKQFHNPKDGALSLMLEAAEVLEHFQWKNGEEMERYAKSAKKEISHELADVLYWVLLLSHDMDIDIAKALEEKLGESAKKYPIEKFKGSSKKYNA